MDPPNPTKEPESVHQLEKTDVSSGGFYRLSEPLVEKERKPKARQIPIFCLGTEEKLWKMKLA